MTVWKMAAASHESGQPSAKIMSVRVRCVRFESMQRRPLPETITETIVEAIESGELSPGERLPTEPDLAKQLGVGRTSLREALSRLQTLGYVDVRR